ncbi:MAG: TIGR03016 family PEP-CTERM system-associated outer membrane protein [Nitrosomonas sp.]|nr:TIGR03016 family PEP-CTERM system-associated outer membrane protein [Nitrosomonas sp.]
MRCFTPQSNHLGVRHFFCATSIFFLILFSISHVAAEIKIRPLLNVSETFTDNVRLGLIGGGTGIGGGFGLGGGFGGGVGANKTDLITQINPGVTINGNGQRYTLNAQYVMNNLIFARNSNLTTIRHMLNADGNAEIIKDLFFVEGNALINQQNIGLLGAQTDSNIFAGNRATIQVYSVSPYLRHQFRDFATSEVRYTKSIVQGGVFGFRDSQRDSFQFGLNSGSSFTKLAWGLSYNNQMIHLDGVDRDIEFERSIANVRYLLTRRFSLTSSGGYERNSFVSVRGRISLPTWTAGFIWSPNRRTNVQFSAGQRFFGDTYFGEISYSKRLLNLRVLYAEDITTFNQQAGAFSTFGALDLNLLGGLGLQDLLGLNNFLTNRVFLQKRFNATIALNGSRNDISFNLFSLSRIPYSAADIDADLIGINNLFLFNNTKQMGGNVAWNYKFSPRTNLITTFSYLRFDFAGSSGASDNLIFSTGLNRNFDEDLRGSLEYRRIDRLSDVQSGSGNISQSANVVTVSVTKNF